MKSFINSLLVLLCLQILSGTTNAQNLLNPKTQPQFVNPLPIPAVIDARGGGSFTIPITQFEQHLGLIHPETKLPMLTKVWGYNGTYPGPTLLVKKNIPINVKWENNLKNSSGLLPHLFPIDATLHWALKSKSDWRELGVPIVTHLHGGHTESASDGLPEQWYTPDFALKGHDFVKEVFHYSNDQEAATLWYHDHAMGITRLNVYAGLAGYYIITDENEMALQSSNKLPASPYDIGLAIQDRMFTEEGQLHYMSMHESSGGPEHSIMPESFGDIILVNGKAWPFLEVEPRQYRFRILNGSDSRFFNLFLSGDHNFIQIGTDNGFLPAPVPLTKLLIGNGERRDVIMDFSDPKLWGKTIIMQNNAKTPFPKGTTVDPQTTGRIMAFKVTKPLNTAYPLTILPNTLRPPIIPLQTTLQPRKLILFETTDDLGRLMAMLGTVEEGIKKFHEPVTENVLQNSTEIWEIYNLSPDAHPIHLHMVTMQLINRQKFSASVDMETGKPSNIRLLGQPKAPTADEAGWKDTYIMYPGEVTRIIATFDLPGKYAWHCHILSHEDHEMMRPYMVTASGNAHSKIIDASLFEKEINLQTMPNPFNNNLAIQFNLKKESFVAINVYDSKGMLIKQLTDGNRSSGLQQFNLNGTNLSSGIYICEVVVDNQRMLRKLVLQK